VVEVNTIGLHFVLFVVGLPQFRGQSFRFRGALPLAGYGPVPQAEFGKNHGMSATPFGQIYERIKERL